MACRWEEASNEWIDSLKFVEDTGYGRDRSGVWPTWTVRAERRRITDEKLQRIVRHVVPQVRDLPPCLVELNLANNDIRDAGVSQMCDALRHANVQLHILRLQRNRIQCQGAEALSRFVSRSRVPLEELHLSHNLISFTEALQLIRSACRREDYAMKRKPLWLRLERQQVRWTDFERSEELQMERVREIVTNMTDELLHNAPPDLEVNGPLLCLVRRTGRCSARYCEHQHKSGPFVHLPYLLQQGSRYISGPDVNTRPEDVPLPPALCVPVVAALRRPRPWQKSAPQVIFENEEMQVINKPPYWNCRWTRCVEDRKEDREWITHDRRSWEQIIGSNQPEYLDLYIARRFQDEMTLAWRDRPDDGAGFLHRLDCQTSGLMIRGKNPESFDALKKQFFMQKVKKGYLCLAHGQIESDGPFRIDAKLSYSRENEETTVVATGGEHAETFVMPLAHAYWGHQTYTFCAVRIVSGRTHQIRKHLEYLGHLLVADRKYNPLGARDKEWCPRLFLHAYEVWINELGTEHRFVAPLALDLRVALQKLQVAENLCEPGRLREVPTTGLIDQVLTDELMDLKSSTQTFDYF